MSVPFQILGFILAVSSSGDNSCRFAGISSSETHWTETWQAASGFELCVARHEKFPLVLQLKTNGAFFPQGIYLDDLIRDYVDIRLSEVQTEEDQRRWEQLRALLIGSLLDAKHGRMEVLGFQLKETHWERLKARHPEEMSLPSGRFEIYFRRASKGPQLLSDRSDL